MVQVLDNQGIQERVMAHFVDKEDPSLQELQNFVEAQENGKSNQGFLNERGSLNWFTDYKSSWRSTGLL